MSSGAPARPTGRALILANLVFVLIGPGLEAVAGPYVLTGFDVGDDLPGGPLRVVGVVLMALGVAGLFAAFAGFAGPGRGTPSPAAPPVRLGATGISPHVRHPMYVATALVIVGEALLLRQPILLLGAALYVAALATLARVREEPALLERFGADYVAYREAVPGWVPSSRPRAG